MIGVDALSVSLDDGKKLLGPVSFQLKQAQVLGLYGPNGSGKSTLLKLMAGMELDHQVGGHVLMDERPFPGTLNSLEKVKQVLYLGSDFRAPFDLTVRELFEMGAMVGSNDLFAVVGSSERHRIAEITERLKLSAFLSRFFRTLSDGEKQLVMFARALIQGTKLLILDESFSKLDLDKLILVAKTVREQAQSGMTFLIASHDLNFLTEVSDELLFLKQGAMLGKGAVSEMLIPARLDELYPDLSLQVVKSPETGKYKILY